MLTPGRHSLLFFCWTVTSSLFSVTENNSFFFPSAPQKSISCCSITSVYVSNVKESWPRRGNARRCMRDPHTLTGRYECSESLNLGGSTYRQTTHILQINTQMHTFRLLPTGRRPSEQHSACHLSVSSGQAAALGKYGFFLKQPLYMSKQLKDFSNQFVVIDYLVTGLGDFFWIVHALNTHQDKLIIFQACFVQRTSQPQRLEVGLHTSLCLFLLC